jgi:hypothetical protein
MSCGEPSAHWPEPGEDVIAWVMRTRSMTFPEAVLYLAALARNEPEGDA